jgi:2-(1,2-epoxy-1,2-dihydrophenyl)acetyl-CoA isomerase
MLLGDKITSSEALQMGMIYKVVPDELLQETAIKTAVLLSEMPTKGIALTKKLLNESFFNTLEKQLDRERDLQIEAADSADYKEGVQAFLEKRKPKFTGE